MERLDDEKLLIPICVSWDNAPPLERLKALELAKQILFRDKSAVLRINGIWQADYTRMTSHTDIPEADRVLLEQGIARLLAEELWKTRP